MSTTPNPQPQPRNFKQNTFESNQHESLTPRSTKSSSIPQWKPSQIKTPNRSKYTKPKPTEAESPFDTTIKDDDSLTSCPSFSAPSYMAPTASAKAKLKATNINTPTDKQTTSRRFSFPLTQGIGSFKWNKVSTNDNLTQKLDKVESFHSTGDISVESTTSLPAGGIGKKAFNRFV